MTVKRKDNIQVITKEVRSRVIRRIKTDNGKPAWSVSLSFKGKHHAWNKYVTDPEELEIYRNSEGLRLHVQLYTCEYKDNPVHRRFMLMDKNYPHGPKMLFPDKEKEENKPFIDLNAIDGPLRSSLMAAAVAAEKEIERLKIVEVKFNRLMTLLDDENRSLEEEFKYPE